MVSLHLLQVHSSLSHLWIYSQLVKLSEDVELNPGPNQGFNQCFPMCVKGI